MCVVCMHACMYVCMYVEASKHSVHDACGSRPVCVVCMFACMYVCTNVCMYRPASTPFMIPVAAGLCVLHMYACLYVCMYVCMYVCALTCMSATQHTRVCVYASTLSPVVSY